MASTVLFVVMVIFAGLLLLTASIAASIGAGNAFNSTYYNTDSRVRSAHQALTIAAALGWSSLVVLIVILIVALVAGGFTPVEISDALLTSSNPTAADIQAAILGEQALSAGHTTQIIIIVVLVIIALITVVVGILAAIAAAQLGGMQQQDDSARTAYIASIVAAVAGVGGIGTMLVAIITYVSIRAARADQLAKTEAFLARTTKPPGPAVIVPTAPTTAVPTVTV